ncbi:MAG: STAS domain-containing protein [Leptospiraceae bacterium]|nr:STAS domain-containing protein [Leptospiraceae bacterium]MCB1314641.1 STAS domain-containing protein [Leptospiraceae bacterium]MCB1319812.1 STAS domain-containing protein [Leptospiraceae bacterium]
MLHKLFEEHRKNENDLAADEALVPEVLNRSTFKQVEQRVAGIQSNLHDRVYLNFSKCRRMDTHGLHALGEFAEQMHANQKHVYLTDLNNDLFKALKLSGIQSRFRFPHHGEYRTEGFGQGNVRC